MSEGVYSAYQSVSTTDLQTSTLMQSTKQQWQWQFLQHMTVYYRHVSFMQPHECQMQYGSKAWSWHTFVLELLEHAWRLMQRSNIRSDCVLS